MLALLARESWKVDFKRMSAQAKSRGLAAKMIDRAIKLAGADFRSRKSFARLAPDLFRVAEADSSL